MLQSLRQHASSWIVKILFAFLILSFGLWGINDIFLGERDPAVAEVSGSKITLSQLSEAVRRETARFQPLFGGTLDREQAKQLGLVDQALDKLINSAVFANAAADYGLLVNDEMIRRHIRSEPAFQDQRGQFDRDQFYRTLSQAGYTEGSYVASLRHDLATQQLVGAVTANTPAQSDMLAALYRFRAEGRIADAIAVPAAEAAPPPVPDEATIAEYYKANSDRFMAPETRTASYVLIDSAALAADAPPIGDDQIKAEYEKRIAEYTVREKRDIEQVVLQNEAEAQKLGALLDQGNSLDAALKELNAGATPVKLGLVEKGDLIPEIGDAAFALKAGEHSAPIKSPLGWHVLKVNTIQEGRVQPFAEVKDALQKDMAQYAGAREAHDRAIKLDDVLASGLPLDEAAGETGLKPVKLPPIDSTGLTSEGKLAAPLLSDPRVTQAIFSTPQGQESQIIELPNDSFAVVRVDQITPAAVKPLAEVKDHVIAGWQQQQRLEATRQRAEEIAARINKGEAPAAVAAAEKLTLKTTPVFTRAGNDAETGLPESVKGQLFELPVGKAAAGAAPDGYVVAVAKEIRPAPEMPEGVRAGLSAQLEQAIAGDLFDQLATALRGRYRVEIHRDIIDTRL